MAGLLADLRYAARQLRAHGGITTAAVPTLALTTGANTALFSLFNALALRTLPVAAADRLVSITTLAPSGREGGMSVPMAAVFGHDTTAFAGVAAYLGGGVMAVDTGGGPRDASLDAVSTNYFEVLGVDPLAGRVLGSADADAASRAAPAVVLGESFWRARFSADPAVIGRIIRIGTAPFTIVGITPAWYTGLRVEIAADVTIPIDTLSRVYPDLAAAPVAMAQAAVARLRDGGAPEQAAARVDTIWRSSAPATLPPDAPESLRTAVASARPLLQSMSTGFSYMREPYGRALQLLMGLTACLFLMACTNVAGLLTARTLARDTEMTTRLMLGASRWSLVRQSLMEGLLIAALGTLAGFPLAAWGAQALAAQFGADYLVPLALDVTPDMRVFGVSLIAVVAAALLFAGVPAWIAGRRSGPATFAASRSIARRSTRWGERLLVVQFALSVVMLAGGAALAASLMRLEAVDPGFDTTKVQLASLTLQPGQQVQDNSSTRLRQLLRSAAALQGVEAAALSTARPGGGFRALQAVRPADAAAPATDIDADLDADTTDVSPGLLETLGIPLRAGRDITWFDDGAAPRVALVSSSLARRMFPEGGALGRHIRIGSDAAAPPIEIVGVTGDVRLSDLHDKRSFAVFLPVSQRTRTADPLHLLLRRHGGQPVGELDVRKAVEGAGQYRVLRLRMLADQVARAFVRERVMAAFGAFFAALTALLVAVGAYASLAFAVRVRRRELGVRLALGASPGGTLRMVVRRGLGLALVGLGAGLPAAVYVGRLLQEQLFDVRVTDPAVLGSVAVFVLGLSIAASLGPARRAAHIDPATALRAM